MNRTTTRLTTSPMAWIAVMALLLGAQVFAHEGHHAGGKADGCEPAMAGCGSACEDCKSTCADCEDSVDRTRAAVKISEEDPARGSMDAPVKIVQYSDYQCSFCARGGRTLKQIEETYGDQVQVVFKDFPLPFHEDARLAAEAGHCAREQGAFWEYHDKLFANQKALGVAKLKTYASQLGLEENQFGECLEGRTYSDKVQTNMAEGQALGVRGTPAYFINGRQLTGAQPFAAFDKIIKDELRLAGYETGR